MAPTKDEIQKVLGSLKACASEGRCYQCIYGNNDFECICKLQRRASELITTLADDREEWKRRAIAAENEIKGNEQSGHWVRRGHKKSHQYFCSECDGKECGPRPYCPRCGKKMSGVERDEQQQTVTGAEGA